MKTKRIKMVARVSELCRLGALESLEAIRQGTLDWKPAPESRSMGEICRHLIRVDAWFLRRLGVEPVLADSHSNAAREVVESLSRIGEQVATVVQNCQADEELQGRRTSLEGKEEGSVGDAVLHMAQHHLYHLAQLVYLRRAQERAWEPPLESWEAATHAIGDYLLAKPHEMGVS